MRQRKPRRQVIAINAINNVFESVMLAHIAAPVTPYSTRLRRGFVLPPVEGEVDWTPGLQVGEAGIRDGSSIRSREDMPGIIMYGPYRHVAAGAYRLKLKLVGNAYSQYHSDAPVAVLEIVSQRNYLAHTLIKPSDLAKGEIAIEVQVDEDQSASPEFSIQTLLRTLTPISVAVSTLSCEWISDVTSVKHGEARALTVKEWLPLLWSGPETFRVNGQILYRSPMPGIVFYGPYWRLPEGDYEAIFELELVSWLTAGRALIQGYVMAARTAVGALTRRLRGAPSLRGSYPICTFQAVSQERELASKVLFAEGLRNKMRVSLSLAVTCPQSRDPDFALELRLLAHGRLPFSVASVTVRRAV
jgi:hypothetical protein